MTTYYQTQTPESEGFLTLNITDPNGYPIENATTIITSAGIDDTYELVTNENGQTNTIPLASPPEENSESAGNTEPYSNYTATINRSGFEPVVINGINIFSGVVSVQNIVLPYFDASGTEKIINIGPNTLLGSYPAKIPEAEIKPQNTSGEIVLDRVVVPESIIVHNGAPSDSSAQNYEVAFPDYIKNVASSEIYPTWPTETIKANIIAIISFTLNRVYTEWYRNMGYYFTITSSTAYDHKWIYERNIFENISEIVDNVFTSYVARPNVKQPILTQYCDGKKTTCAGMSQWGSKALGDQGYDALAILRRYYGSEIYINTAEDVAGVPKSYPGYVLSIGDTGSNVRIVQEQLNSIKKAYPALPAVAIDGIYGEKTADAIRTFQKIFKLPVTGEVDYATWYKLSYLYVALEKLAAL